MSRGFLGAALIILGAGWLLQSAGLIDISSDTVLPLVLIGIGVALVFRSFSGSSSGLVIAGIVVAVILAGDNNRNFNMNMGERSHVFRPRTSDDLVPFDVGTGSLRIDLLRLKLTRKTFHVQAHVGAGKLLVLVPNDVAVKVDAHTGIGSIRIFRNRSSNGLSSNDTYATPGYDKTKPRIEVDADVGAGSIVVQRRAR